MILIISLVLAALFLWGCAKPLKRHPVPFYIAAVVIALAVLVCTVKGVSFPGWFQSWVWPLFSRSAFATALFAVVMWTGALPNGSRAIKFLMPVRGELSILACILTLGHNASYGRTYFRLLFTQPGRLPANQLAAAVCSLVMILIMLPLFITSFPAVRKKMNARNWKRLQCLAYGFYALLYVHVMLLSVPYALDGRSGYVLNVLVYSAVFLGYAACRVMKAQARRTRQPDKLRRRQAAALAGALVVALCLTGVVSISASKGEETLAETPARQETRQPEGDSGQSPEPETPVLPEAPEEPQDVRSEPLDSEQDPVPSADAQTEKPPEEEPEQTAVPEEPAQSAIELPRESQPQPAEPEPTPEPTPTPTPARTYQNGTFSGSGEGYWSTITVSVTIQDDVITGITVTSADEDEPYYSDALSVINSILTLQSTHVDTVSGATYSSGGIIDAVAAALANAKN